MRRIHSTAGKRPYRWDYQELRYLVFLLTQPKNYQETLNLFFDLHTQKEMSEMIRRVIIASLLQEGVTYEEIQKYVGTSSNTIAKIQNKLLREKSVLEIMLRRTGTFRSFNEDQRQPDPIQRRIDRILKRATLGLYQPRNKRWMK